MPQEEIAHRIRAKLVHIRNRVNNIPERFAHFLTARSHKTVIKHLIRRLDARRQEHRLPHKRLKPNLILPRNLDGFAAVPEFFKVAVGVFGPAERRDVVGERIKPHVHHMLIIPRHGNTPRHTFFFARNRKIRKSFFDELECIRFARSRNNRFV